MEEKINYIKDVIYQNRKKKHLINQPIVLELNVSFFYLVYNNTIIREEKRDILPFDRFFTMRGRRKKGICLRNVSIFFTKHQWLTVIFSSALFGLWHILNGSFIQVGFTFCIGMVFGFCKYWIKEYQYLGVAFSRGLYDFLNIVIKNVHNVGNEGD